MEFRRDDRVVHMVTGQVGTVIAEMESQNLLLVRLDNGASVWWDEDNCAEED